MSTQQTPNQTKHDVAISWLMVRLQSLQAGLDEAQRGMDANTEGFGPEYWVGHIASYSERIKLVTESINVLKRDAGIATDAPAVEDGTVLHSEVVQ